MLKFIIDLFAGAICTGAVLLAIMLASILFCPAAHSLELDQVYINYKQFTPGGTSYLITNNGLPDRALDKEISLHLDTTLLEYAYWNNVIHGTTDQSSITGDAGQFRTIGWQFQLGVRLTDWLDFQYEHHSQHILDHEGPNHFPVEDSFGINVYLYRPKTHRPSIF